MESGVQLHQFVNVCMWLNVSLWLTTSLPSHTAVPCGNPPTVTNSGRTSTGTTFGEITAYTCNTGYQRSGSATISCLASGSWSTAPVCTGKTQYWRHCIRLFPTALCDDLPSLVNVMISYGSSTSPHPQGTMATQSCVTGYTVLAGGGTRTCQSDRAWSGSPLTCTRM